MARFVSVEPKPGDSGRAIFETTLRVLPEFTASKTRKWHAIQLVEALRRPDNPGFQAQPLMKMRNLRSIQFIAATLATASILLLAACGGKQQGPAAGGQ